MRKNITMDIIAEKAGVSKSTVSYVLSGKKKLSETVKLNVMNIAEELGYRPQQVAPELFLDKVKRIRLETGTSRLSNDSANCKHEIIRGIMNHLVGTNYELCMSPNPGNFSKADVTSTKGIISLFHEKPANGEEFLRQIPTVYIGHHTDGQQSSTVDADGLGAGYQAATWLLKKNARRILFVKDLDWQVWYDQYEKGIQMAHEEFKTAWNSDNSVTIESSVELIDIIIKNEPFDAIIVPSDIMSNQLAYHPLCKNTTILSMKQFPDMLLSENRHPGTVFPACQMGGEAAAMLLGIISKQRVAHNSVIISCDFNKGLKNAN